MKTVKAWVLVMADGSIEDHHWRMRVYSARKYAEANIVDAKAEKVVRVEIRELKPRRKAALQIARKP